MVLNWQLVTALTLLGHVLVVVAVWHYRNGASLRDGLGTRAATGLKALAARTARMGCSVDASTSQHRLAFCPVAAVVRTA